MKHLDAVDWPAVVAAAPRWDGLPLEARRAFLGLRRAPNNARTLGPWRGMLKDARLVQALAPDRVAVAADAFPLFDALRALRKARPFGPAPRSEDLMLAYVREHFARDDYQLLRNGRPGDYSHAAAPDLADAASSAEWAGDLLTAGTPDAVDAWEKRRGGAVRGFRLNTPARVDAVQRLVRGLLEAGTPLPLSHLPALLPSVPLGEVAHALHTALGYLLVLGAVREADLQPVFGLWPPAAEWLSRPQAAAPQAAAPVETVDAWEGAFAMDDMVAVLVAASSEPVRLRGDDVGVFARTRNALGKRLTLVPLWAAEWLDLAHPADAYDQDDPYEIHDPPDDAARTEMMNAVRVDTAAAMLSAYGLAKVKGRRGENLSLVPTPAGTHWLGMGDRERLQALLDMLRASRQRSPGDWTSSQEGPPFFPVSTGWMSVHGGVDLRNALCRALLSMPTAPAEAGELLRFLARGDNPVRSFGGMSTVERREGGWIYLLRGFLLHRLAPLGGLRFARTADSKVCVGLTSAGRYLLGGADELEYGTGPIQGEVVVQPNFEVVFLAPSAQAEARIGRYAERIGSGVGTLFRITRPAVLAAVEAGATAERVLGDLASAISRPLPANVARQVRDWVQATRRVRIGSAVLVDCPDAETAVRVHAAGGKQVERLTDTVLRLTGGSTSDLNAMLKKLRASGIFREP
ncbi:MAG: hypothetical protein JWM27_4424 [Gemmatimonadetes bacterium]|nr:hypothetical protein [Gemmatimonadota bacterium]